MRSLLKCCGVAMGLRCFLLLPAWAHAQTAGARGGRIAALKQAVADAKMSADNTWMLVSSALVLMMTGPGLALFYSGLVRKKNVLGTMMQSFAMMAIITVTWVHPQLQPGLRRRHQLHRRAAPSVFCAAWARRRTSPMRTFPRRPT